MTGACPATTDLIMRVNATTTTIIAGYDTSTRQHQPAEGGWVIPPAVREVQYISEVGVQSGFFVLHAVLYHSARGVNNQEP